MSITKPVTYVSMLFIPGGFPTHRISQFIAQLTNRPGFGSASDGCLVRWFRVFGCQRSVPIFDTCPRREPHRRVVHRRDAITRWYATVTRPEGRIPTGTIGMDARSRCRTRHVPAHKFFYWIPLYCSEMN